MLVLLLSHQVAGHRLQFLIVLLLKSVLELLWEIFLHILGMVLPPNWAVTLCWHLCYMFQNWLLLLTRGIHLTKNLLFRLLLLAAHSRVESLLMSRGYDTGWICIILSCLTRVYLDKHLLNHRVNRRLLRRDRNGSFHRTWYNRIKG